MGKKDETNENKAAPAQPVDSDATADVFVANEVFPDAASIFTVKPLTLPETKDDAYVVLDTNPLLVPFGIGPQTLAEIERTYRNLLKEQRLIIPAQVAREFARNRVKKLGELYSKVTRRRSDLKNFQQGSYPLLEADPEYTKARELEKKLDGLLKELPLFPRRTPQPRR